MFRSEIGSGFEDPGGTPPPRIPGSTPPPPPPPPGSGGVEGRSQKTKQNKQTNNNNKEKKMCVKRVLRWEWFPILAFGNFPNTRSRKLLNFKKLFCFIHASEILIAFLTNKSKLQVKVST